MLPKVVNPPNIKKKPPIKCVRVNLTPNIRSLTFYESGHPRPLDVLAPSLNIISWCEAPSSTGYVGNRHGTAQGVQEKVSITCSIFELEAQNFV